MASKKPKKLFSIHKPFAVLMGLRDGELKNIEQLTTSQSRHKTVMFAERWDAANVITFNRETGALIPKRAFFDALNSLDLSLSGLTEFMWSSVVANPIFHFLDSSTRIPPRPEVFVLMPFSAALQPFYQDHIRPTIERMGHSCARADDFFTANAVIEDIWVAIRDARVILADCTGRNPNVFYEIGIAHTVGTPVVLMSQSVEDIPFDLRHRRTIIYEYTPRGVRQFEETLVNTVLTVLWEMIDDPEDEQPTEDWKRFVRQSRR